MIRPLVKEAIKKAQDAGVAVLLATGRMYRAALPFAQELELTGPLICYGGALVVDPATRETLFCHLIDHDGVRRVIEIARRRMLTVGAYINRVADGRLQPKDEDLIVELGTVVGDESTMPFSFYLARSNGKAVNNLLVELDQLAEEARRAYGAGDETSYSGTMHMAIASYPITQRQLLFELREELGSDLAVTSGHPLLCEIDSPGVSKGAALREVALKLGVERERIMAIGDDWNDLAMLQYAGLGLAMADAAPEVIAAADATAPPASEDGVAWAFERYLFDPRPGFSRRE